MIRRKLLALLRVFPAVLIAVRAKAKSAISVDKAESIFAPLPAANLPTREQFEPPNLVNPLKDNWQISVN